MKAKILIDDGSGRFKSGEIGELLENDFEKYDYCIDLGILNVAGLSYSPTEYRRRYYFYKDEIELID